MYNLFTQRRRSNRKNVTFFLLLLIFSKKIILNFQYFFHDNKFQVGMAWVVATYGIFIDVCML